MKKETRRKKAWVIIEDKRIAPHMMTGQALMEVHWDKTSAKRNLQANEIVVPCTITYEIPSTK